MPTTYPCYYSLVNDVMLFKSETKGLLVSKNLSGYEIQEIILDEEWIKMYMEEGDPVDKDFFATMLYKATLRFETYFKKELLATTNY